MFDAIAPRYDAVNRMISMGLDRSWRRTTIASLELAPPCRIVDIGCGTGDLAHVARRFGYQAAGFDLAFAMLRASRYRDLALAEADAARLPLAEGSVDGLVSGFALRNFADLAAVFSEAARVLRPGGRMALLEVDEPDSPALRAGHRLWFNHVVPVIGGLLSDGDAYRYLPRSVAYLPGADGIQSLIEQAGFHSYERRRLHGGLVQVLVATRSGSVPLLERRR
jgi:demethylmenaquinone methyltransferase / 2-methoxy-6-polyprenyl-1,4-benzoquinol methylase